MASSPPTLHLLCGKIASGKSTLAAELGKSPNTIIIAEDEWLAALFGDEMSNISDFVRNSAKLRQIIGPHIIDLLKSDVSVVLDFQANTLKSRDWMRSLFEQANAAHKLHYLEVSDAICKKRLQARNSAGDHDFAATDKQFDTITSHFVVPTLAENFNIVLHNTA